LWISVKKNSWYEGVLLNFEAKNLFHQWFFYKATFSRLWSQVYYTKTKNGRTIRETIQRQYNVSVYSLLRAWCKTIVTTLFYITNYNSFAPSSWILHKSLVTCLCFEFCCSLPGRSTARPHMSQTVPCWYTQLSPYGHSLLAEYGHSSWSDRVGSASVWKLRAGSTFSRLLVAACA